MEECNNRVFLSTGDLKFIENDSGNAGYDLRASEAANISPGERKLIKTDLKLEMPSTMFAKVESRSGLALKGIDARGGVIDSNYRGYIGVILHNTSQNLFTVNVGDRIAQLLFLPVIHPTFQLTNRLANTNRGESGFGSSGLS